MFKVIVTLFLISSDAMGQFFPSPCYTIPAGPCASEAVQVHNATTLDMSYSEHILHNINMGVEIARVSLILADAILNSKTQNGLPLAQIGTELAAIDRIQTLGKAFTLSDAELAKKYPVIFPGYNTSSVAVTGKGNFQEQYRQWASVAQDTTQALMLANVSAHGHQLSNAVNVITGLQAILRIVDGRLRAQQVAASMAQRQAESLEAIHATMLRDSQARGAYQSFQIQEKMTAQQAGDQFFRLAKPVGDGYVPPMIGSVGP